ncbi:hypothetical protein Naga_101615g1, partial [Nannochloropsis gaditana]
MSSEINDGEPAKDGLSEREGQEGKLERGGDGGGAAETQTNSPPQPANMKTKEAEMLIKQAFATQNADLSREMHKARASISSPSSAVAGAPLPLNGMGLSTSGFGGSMPAEGGHIWRETDISAYLITGAVGGADEGMQREGGREGG